MSVLILVDSPSMLTMTPNGRKIDSNRVIPWSQTLPVNDSHIIRSLGEHLPFILRTITRGHRSLLSRIKPRTLVAYRREYRILVLADSPLRVDHGAKPLYNRQHNTRVYLISGLQNKRGSQYVQIFMSYVR